MKKSKTSFLLLQFLLLFLVQKVNGQFSGGTGVIGDPYQISNKMDLYTLSNNPSYWGSSFVQTTNIYFTSSDFVAGGDFYNGGAGFIPIGSPSSHFTGRYNGRRFIIDSLFINRPNSDTVGFFGIISGSIIDSLGLTNSNVIGRNNTGTLIGRAGGSTIAYCFTQGNVIGNDRVGGLIGSMGQTYLSLSYSTCSVNGNNYVGGLIGYKFRNTAENCYATGDVNGNSIVGGFAGQQGAGVIQKCYSIGLVTGVTGSGGFIGSSPIDATFSFYDTLTTGFLGYGATPSNTSLMHTLSTFTDAAWDFVGESVNGTNDYWNISCGYPFLAWQSDPSISFSVTLNPTACDSYVSPSGNYVWTSTGIYHDTIVNLTGCDSLFTINLTINSSSTGTDTRTECNSYTWIDGNNYTSSNNTATFNIVGGAANGCDSLVTLNLTILNSATGTDTRTECNSYTWIDGNNYTSSNNTATFNIVGGAANGCDSLVTLDLTIINSTTGTDTRTECNSYTWIDGNNYSSSNNTATFNIVGGAVNGCDSLVTLDLTILNSAAGTDTRTECNSYNWIDGNNYTSSNNTATFNIVGGAANGCDSLVTLDLTIINSTTGTDTRTECNSYTWIDGNNYTSSNNTATFNIVSGAANGCDSLVTLDLTIINSTTGTDTRTECNSYTWIDGNNYTSSNNTATFNIVSGAANGCDSLVTLDLTILNSANGTDTRTECNSFTWIDGNNYTSSNNTATFNIVGGAVNGCDSLVTLDLTILNSATGTDTRTECNSYTWIDGNNYTSSNNTATFNIVGGAANGCDSLVTLNLTINSVSDITTTTTGINISANNGSATYQWLDCDNNNAIIVGETSQSFTPTANGNYAVELTENGCLDTSACISITTVGIIENSFGDKLLVYPNPTNGNFSIDLGSKHENSQILITDITGKLIDSKIIYQSQILNLSIEEPAGIYLVILRAGDKTAVIRLIKK